LFIVLFCFVFVLLFVNVFNQGGVSSAAGSSRLAYFESEEPSGYTSKPAQQKKEEAKPEILFSEEGFRLKRKPDAADASTKKKDGDDRFASSKAISSDEVEKTKCVCLFILKKKMQYFGRKEATDPETAARLAKFAGSSSISSADFYERDEGVCVFFFLFLLLLFFSFSSSSFLSLSGFSNSNNNNGGDDLAINIAATAKVWE
jgi:hypothetical protein